MNAFVIAVAFEKWNVKIVAVLDPHGNVYEADTMIETNQMMQPSCRCGCDMTKFVREPAKRNVPFASRLLLSLDRRGNLQFASSCAAGRLRGEAYGK